MGFKSNHIFFLSAFLYGALSTWAQNVDSIYLINEKIEPVSIVLPFYDADNIEIGTYYYTGTTLDSTLYYKTKNNKIKVSFEMPAYTGGYDSLRLFFEEEYQKIERNDSLPNAMTLVYILLEKDKISDVRIGERIGYSNHRFNYDKAIKDIIYKTQRKWIVNEEEKYPLLFIYLFPLPN